ncbi:aminoglycoside phosphotransferase family protein [Kribbella sp. NPDC048915]|uniref:phosphotransferase family protein n=1 Tax=Kribbella sp. NPDC048915 TaxID=3155148 RepID=UPI0033DB854A
MTHSVETSGQTLTKRYRSWSRDEPVREWTALTLLTRTAPGLAPVPLELSPGDSPWLTMTVVPGSPLQGSLTAEQLGAVGDALETLWSVPSEELPAIDLPALVERTRSGLRALCDGDDVIGVAARAWLDDESPDLTPIDDPVVAHGDPNLANYLWDGDRVRIVDFEDAGRGDRAIELANLVEHLSWRQTDPTSLVRRFAVDPDRFRAARCLWAGFWLMLIGPGGPSAARNPPGTAQAQARRVLRLVAG